MATHRNGRNDGQRLPDPEAMRRYPFNLAVKLFAGGDVRATPEQAASFRRHAQAGDPAADRLVALMHQRHRAGLPPLRPLLEQALAQGIETVPDAPAELVDFMTTVTEVPYWVDPDRLERGALALARAGTGLLPAFVVALGANYASPTGNQVLLRAGDLYRKAPSRTVESVAWVHAVTTPGKLGRFSDGFQAAVRIRMTHAHIRAGMHARGDWDYDACQQPVNQMLYTASLLTFSLIVIMAAELQGTHFTRAERDAVFHLWRYLAHVIGIPPLLIPANEQDIWRLTWMVMHEAFVPDASAGLLGGALLDAIPVIHGLDTGTLSGRLRARYLRQCYGNLGRLILGHALADALTFPPLSPVLLPMAAQFALHAALDTGARLLPGGQALLARRGLRRRARLLEQLARNTSADLSYVRESAPRTPATTGAITAAAATGAEPAATRRAGDRSARRGRTATKTVPIPAAD